MSSFTLLMIGVAILIVVLVLGVPVPYSFGFAVIYMVAVFGYAESTIIPVGFAKMGSMTFLAMPMFILVGSIMERGKIGEALIGFVEMFVGRLRGGLGVVAVVSSAVFGAICGSSAATLSCIGGIMYPKLMEQGYDRGFATALVLNAAPLGLLIPPSSTMILYAWLSGESVLACFMATIVPGIILAIFLCAVNIYMAHKNPLLDPKVLQERYQIPKFISRGGWERTKFSVPALLMPLLVLGGIYGGVMTPTEASAVAVIYAIPVAIYFYKSLRGKELKECFVKAVRTSGGVCGMIFTVSILSRFFVLENLPNMMMDLMMTLGGGTKVGVLLMINIFMVFIGMLMDDGSGITLCTPLLLPICESIGVSPIQFAAILGINLGMGCVTPPTAPLLYMGCGIADTPVNKALKPTMILILFAWLPTLILVTYVPDLSLWLPRLAGMAV